MTFSSKYYLCKPSSVVRLSKSGILILVNTTFILQARGLLVFWYAPSSVGILEQLKQA